MGDPSATTPLPAPQQNAPLAPVQRGSSPSDPAHPEARLLPFLSWALQSSSPTDGLAHSYLPPLPAPSPHQSVHRGQVTPSCAKVPTVSRKPTNHPQDSPTQACPLLCLREVLCFGTCPITNVNSFPFCQRAKQGWLARPAFCTGRRGQELALCPEGRGSAGPRGQEQTGLGLIETKLSYS